MNPLTKPSKAEVDGMIIQAKTTYTRLPSGKNIVCEIVLTNGWTTYGVASVVDLDNYDEQRGKEAALAKAMVGVWDHVAALKQQAIHDGRIESRHVELSDSHNLAYGNNAVNI
jgi:hypothetical protein